MKDKLPRIQTAQWDDARPGAYGVYNASHLPSGARVGLTKPWTVVGPATFRVFHTHAEALQWATQEAAKR